MVYSDVSAWCNVCSIVLYAIKMWHCMQCCYNVCEMWCASNIVFFFMKCVGCRVIVRKAYKCVNAVTLRCILATSTVIICNYSPNNV